MDAIASIGKLRPMDIMAQNTENRALNDKFMLRLPDGMRDRIKAAAEHNNRSMNAEIVMALEYWLEADLPYTIALGAGASIGDARSIAMMDRDERNEAVTTAYQEEIERSIALLQQLRHLIKPHPQDDPRQPSFFDQEDGYGDGDGAYGDSDGNGDGMGGAADGGGKPKS